MGVGTGVRGCFCCSIQGLAFDLKFEPLLLLRGARPLSGDYSGGDVRRFRFLGLPHVACHEYLCPVASGF